VDALNPISTNFALRSMNFNEIEVDMMEEKDEDIVTFGPTNRRVKLTAFSATGLLAKMCPDDIEPMNAEEFEFCSSIQELSKSNNDFNAKVDVTDDQDKNLNSVKDETNNCPGSTLEVCRELCPVIPLIVFQGY